MSHQEQEMRDAMNHFLVKVFNEILKAEEKTISKYSSHSLSVREMHVLEQVCDLQDGDNRAASIAARLHITAGTLTTSVSQLEKKGYVIRVRDDKDRRVVHIRPTEKAINANKMHRLFHEKMVDHIMDALHPEDKNGFLAGLQQISEFFDDQYTGKKEKG